MMTVDVIVVAVCLTAIFFTAILAGAWAARVAVRLEREHTQRAERHWERVRSSYPPPPEPPKRLYDFAEEFRSAPGEWSSVIKEPLGFSVDKDGDYECSSCKMKLTVVTKKTSHESEDGLD